MKRLQKANRVISFNILAKSLKDRAGRKTEDMKLFLNNILKINIFKTIDKEIRKTLDIKELFDLLGYMGKI